jgi:hypothetical protein
MQTKTNSHLLTWWSNMISSTWGTHGAGGLEQGAVIRYNNWENDGVRPVNWTRHVGGQDFRKFIIVLPSIIGYQYHPLHLAQRPLYAGEWYCFKLVYSIGHTARTQKIEHEKWSLSHVRVCGNGLRETWWDTRSRWRTKLVAAITWPALISNLFPTDKFLSILTG